MYIYSLFLFAAAGAPGDLYPGDVLAVFFCNPSPGIALPEGVQNF